jgi:hypothetical protein
MTGPPQVPSPQVPTTPSASAQGVPVATPVQLATGAFCAEAAPAAARRLWAGGGRVGAGESARRDRGSHGAAPRRRLGARGGTRQSANARAEGRDIVGEGSVGEVIGVAARG